MTKYIGIWYGGMSYSVSSWTDHTELFNSLEAAKNELQARYNGRSTSVPVIWDENGLPAAGTPVTVGTPAVDEHSNLWLVELTDTTNLDSLETDSYPDYVVSFGPRGGVRAERYL